MSLCTDLFFYNALKADADVVAKVSDRIFNTVRNEEDENEDRQPYIMITNDGGNNDTGTKDDQGESDYDHVNISVCVVDDNRESLAILVDLVRTAIKQAFTEQDQEEQGFLIDDYTLTFTGVEFDQMRPAYYQTLTYACETYNS